MYLCAWHGPECQPDVARIPSIKSSSTFSSSHFSGGQVRRVSIAVTLLHHPSLVILDEPTSGLDPLLANMFWRYLNRLSVQGQTIIITTHYIEEARQANVVRPKVDPSQTDKQNRPVRSWNSIYLFLILTPSLSFFQQVGLMRHGELLAESPPEMLITKYGVESLEDVFLCLCNKQSHEEEIVTDPDLDKVR